MRSFWSKPKRNFKRFLDELDPGIGAAAAEEHHIVRFHLADVEIARGKERDAALVTACKLSDAVDRSDACEAGEPSLRGLAGEYAQLRIRVESSRLNPLLGVQVLGQRQLMIQQFLEQAQARVGDDDVHAARTGSREQLRPQRPQDGINVQFGPDKSLLGAPFRRKPDGGGT